MSEFKKRFIRWKKGEKVYEAGKILPEVVVTADDPIKKLVEDVNARSNADFVNRVKDPNRAWIQDWEHDGYVATHKLSWAEDDGKAVVFPNLQNINGELHDFTDPKYNHGKWDALDSAIERGDTLLMTPKQAKMYTENYKKYYPKGKTFDCGKSLPKYDEGADDKTYLPEYEYEATVTPQGTSVEKHKRITNEEDWLKYWGNVGAGYVNKALEEAAPYVLNGMSMLMGNPISAFAGMGGSILGSELGAKISPQASAIGDIVGGIALDPANLLRVGQIGKNIANRNLFAYKYILPWGYENPVKRGANLAKHLLTDAHVPNPELNPEYWVLHKDLSAILSFRDDAWRKYLGIPERFGIYTPNADGTFSYNLKKIKQISPNYAIDSYAPMVVPDGPDVIGDWVTGNGGNVSSKVIDFGYGIGSDSNKRFGMLHLSDLWDVLPFSRSLPSWTKALPKSVQKKISNFEIGPLVKGRPFLLETDVPFTTSFSVDESGKLGKEMAPEFINDNIMPERYFNYMTYGSPEPPNFNTTSNIRSDFSKSLTALSKKHDKGKSIQEKPRLKRGTYTVKPGDSPWRISHNSGMTLDRFYELNPWTNIEKGGIIHPNDKVIIDVPDNNPTYIPRMSKELLEGVTVTAKRKPVRPKLNVSAQLSTAKSVGSNSDRRLEYKLPQWQTVEQPEVFKSKELLDNIFKTLQKQVKPKQAVQKLQPVVKKTPKIDNQQLAEYQLPQWLSLEQPNAFKTMQELEQVYGNTPRQIKPKASSSGVKKTSNAQYSQKAYPLTPEITKDGFISAAYGVKDIARSAAYGARDVARSAASLLPDSDFKQDVMGVLDKDKSLTASYIEMKSGLELRARQYTDLLMSVFDSDDPEDLPVNSSNKLKPRDIIANKPIENVVSDTTSVVRNPEDRKFKATRIINMDTTPVGFRNRFHEYDENGKGVGGENYDPVKDTQGVIINTYTPLLRYGHQMLQKEDADFGYGKRHWNYYIGVTDDGKFVHGSDYTKLPQNASYARTMAHKITHLSDTGLGKSPQMHFENGKSSPINFTSSTRSIDKTHRGGGLISAGGETIHLEGSLKHMNEQIERLKRRHNVDSVLYIEEDNGSYSERLSTKDHEITSKDWLYYMHQNVSPANGNSIYIKGLPNLGKSIKPVNKRK